MQSLSALLIVFLGTVGGSVAQELEDICRDDQLTAYDSNVVRSRVDNAATNVFPTSSSSSYAFDPRVSVDPASQIIGFPTSITLECAEGWYQSDAVKHCLFCDENGYNFQGCNAKLCEKKCELNIEDPPAFAQHVSQMGMVSGHPQFTCKTGYKLTYCGDDLTCTDGQLMTSCAKLCEDPTYSACDLSQLDNVVSIKITDSTNKSLSAFLKNFGTWTLDLWSQNHVTTTVQCAEGYKATACASKVICDSATKEWIRAYQDWDWHGGGAGPYPPYWDWHWDRTTLGQTGRFERATVRTCTELCEKACSSENMLGIGPYGHPNCAVGQRFF